MKNKFPKSKLPNMVFEETLMIASVFLYQPNDSIRNWDSELINIFIYIYISIKAMSCLFICLVFRTLPWWDKKLKYRTLITRALSLFPKFRKLTFFRGVNLFLYKNTHIWFIFCGKEELVLLNAYFFLMLTYLLQKFKTIRCFSRFFS